MTKPLKTLKILTARFDRTKTVNNIKNLHQTITQNRSTQNTDSHLKRPSIPTYRYPLIQYKSGNPSPMLLGIGEGSEQLCKFFDKPHKDSTIDSRMQAANLRAFSITLFDVGIGKNLLSYTIKRWQALNQQNYRQYISLESETERKAFLQKMLVAHILSFASGINWTVKQQIELHITGRPRPKMVCYNGVNVIAFDLAFETNVRLPDFIGLGKGVRFGFGVVHGR